MHIKLSKRETDVILLLVEGKYPKNIADDLEIKENTVRGYIQSLHKKLGTHSLYELTSEYLKNFPPSGETNHF